MTSLVSSSKKLLMNSGSTSTLNVNDSNSSRNNSTISSSAGSDSTSWDNSSLSMETKEFIKKALEPLVAAKDSSILKPLSSLSDLLLAETVIELQENVSKNDGKKVRFAEWPVSDKYDVEEYPKLVIKRDLCRFGAYDDDDLLHELIKWNSFLYVNHEEYLENQLENTQTPTRQSPKITTQYHQFMFVDNASVTGNSDFDEEYCPSQSVPPSTQRLRRKNNFIRSESDITISTVSLDCDLDKNESPQVPPKDLHSRHYKSVESLQETLYESNDVAVTCIPTDEMQESVPVASTKSKRKSLKYRMKSLLGFFTV